MPPLAALLSSNQPSMQEKAAGALANLAVGSQLNEGAIIAAGTMALLVPLLRLDQPAVQEQAACALVTL